MIDKIFPVTLKMHVEKNTNALLMYVCELHAYINECKERYIQYHPEKKKCYYEDPFLYLLSERNIETLRKGAPLYFHIPRSAECVRLLRPRPLRPHHSISREERDALAGSLSIEDAEEMIDAIKDAKSLPPVTQQEVKPHKCPVCEGAGAFIIAPLSPQERLKRKEENYKCHACNGTGVLGG